MMTSFKTGIKKTFLYGIALLFILIVSTPLAITPIINTTYIKEKLSSVIHQKTGVRINASKFSLTVFPQPNVTISNFNINPDNRIDIDIESIKLSIDLQELLHGKFNVDKVSIHHPRIKPGKKPDRLKDRQPLKPDPFSTAKFIQRLKKIFKLLPDNQHSFVISLEDVTSPYFERMDGSIYLSKISEEVVFNATLKKITVNPSLILDFPLNNYIDLNRIELDQLTLNGKLNTTTGIKGKCSFTGPTLRSKNNQTLFDSDFFEAEFNISELFHQVDIKPFKLNYPDGTIGVHFQNDETRKKSEIQFTGSNIYIDQAREMSKILFKANTVTETLFDILKAGIAQKITVSFISKNIKNLFDPTHFSLNGKIKDGLVHIPATPLTASRVNGAARINNGILDITAETAMIQTSTLEKGTLSIDLLHPVGVPFKGEFSLDVDLSMLPAALISLLPHTQVSKELLLVHEVEGRARARLSLLLEPDAADLIVKVHTDDFSATGSYDPIPGKIALDNINVTYEPDRIELKHLTGVVNTTELKDLNAVFNLKTDNQIKILSGSGLVNLDSVIPWLQSYKTTKDMIYPIQDGKGKIYISSIELSGPLFTPDQWKFELSGSTVGIDLTTHLAQDQIKNLSCQYHVSENGLNLTRIQTKIANLSWLESRIEKKYLNSILVPFELNRGALFSDTKHSSFKTDIQFNSGPELSIDMHGNSLSSLALNSITFLDPGLSDGMISLSPDKEKFLFDFNGRFDTATLNKLIKSDSFLGKKINQITGKQPIVLYTDTDNLLNITFKTIDLSSFSGQPQTISKKRRFLPRKNINFKADKLLYKNLTLTNLDSKLSFNENHSYIRIRKANLCDLEASGYINLKNDIVYANIPVKAHGKDNIQDLMSCLFKKENFMTGPYSLTCNLECNETRADFLNKFFGSIQYTAQKGRIYKATLLSRIFSVLNVSKLFKGTLPNLTQDGFAYNTISIEADIKDSIIYLSKAIIDGQDMTLIFSGWIDPINDKINLTCLVAPFKTVDLIIEHIPVINTLMSGRLISIPIRASGKLSDPAVIPLEPSAVGMSLVNMMSDILKTPVKLWNNMWDDEKKN